MISPEQAVEAFYNTLNLPQPTNPSVRSPPPPTTPLTLAAPHIERYAQNKQSADTQSKEQSKSSERTGQERVLTEAEKAARFYGHSGREVPFLFSAVLRLKAPSP